MLAGALGKTVGSQSVGELSWQCSASIQRDTMYGLLCESLHDFIKESYGDDVWKLVRERADVRLHSFVTHQVQWSCVHALNRDVFAVLSVQPSQCVCSYFYSVCFCLKPNSPDIKTCFFSLYICVYLQVYSESVIPRIAKAASGVTGTPYNELMNSWGVYFLGFVGKYGYDRILKVKKKNLRLDTVRTLLSWGSCLRKL